jgi:hypothetical protein
MGAVVPAVYAFANRALRSVTASARPNYPFAFIRIGVRFHRDGHPSTGVMTFAFGAIQHHSALALRLFRDDTLMAKREARRKKYFVAPSARRKMKAVAARRGASRARRKWSAILPGEALRLRVRR